MTVVLQGANSQGKMRASIQNVRYDYDYPRGLDLDPHSDWHRKLVSRVMDHANDSHRVISQHHDEWRKRDRVLKAYVDPEWLKRLEKENAKDSSEASIMPKLVMPVSHANLETLLTYMVAAFLQDPIFRFSGTGPEDELGARLGERVIAHHCTRTAVGLSIKTALRDGFAYGVGFSTPTWRRDFGEKIVRDDLGFWSQLRDMFIKTGYKKRRKNALIFEGNQLDAIDPYKALPDPNVPAHKVQDGQFFGWIDRTQFMALLRKEGDRKTGFFNIKYLNHFDGRSALTMTESAMRDGSYEREYVGTNKPS